MVPLSIRRARGQPTEESLIHAIEYAVKLVIITQFYFGHFMIVVIADDLTGAGEIGGIGLEYGLKVELQRKFYSESDVELLVIDTDTRSFSPQKAGQVIREALLSVEDVSLPVEWIYKKTDSVLRGPVASELEALQEVMRVARVLLVPANPSKGRIVRNGNYLINGKPLSETEFCQRP